MNDLSEIWNEFEKMNSTQIYAATQDSDNKKSNWYKSSKVPHYGHGGTSFFWTITIPTFSLRKMIFQFTCLGINTGVALMNLKKMRKFGWQELVIKIFNEYRSKGTKLPLLDQDIVNIIFNLHPGNYYNFLLQYASQLPQNGGAFMSKWRNFKTNMFRLAQHHPS